MKNNDWTNEQLKFLIKNKNKLTYKEIAKSINKTEVAIPHKVNKLTNVKRSNRKTKYHQTSTIRNIINKYKKQIQLKRKLRELFRNTTIRDLDKIPDCNR